MLKKILLVLFVALVVAQFFRPEKNDGDLASLTAFVKDAHPPKSIQNTLETSCYDCHSNTTNYPWYDNITPVNYWLNGHINHGKKHLNFSNWSSYSPKQKAHKLDELVEEIKEGHMPLGAYLWMHKEAKLTQKQIEDIEAWVKLVKVKYFVQRLPI